MQSGQRFGSWEKMYSLKPGNHREPDMHRYVPIDGEMMEIHVTLRWDVVHRR